MLHYSVAMVIKTYACRKQGLSSHCSNQRSPSVLFWNNHHNAGAEGADDNEDHTDQ